MNEDVRPDQTPPTPEPPPTETPAPPQSDDNGASAVRASTLYRLCEEVIALRERCDRQHREFEKSLTRTQSGFQTAFNSFAADTQKAYQQLRQELVGEKRTTLALFNELLDLALDLETIVAARPAAGDAEGLTRWADSVEVHLRKVRDGLGRHGIHPYDAEVGAAYNPAQHERVAGQVVEGMEPFRIAEQQQRGFASQQPEFVLRRPKVVVTEEKPKPPAPVPEPPTAPPTST